MARDGPVTNRRADDVESCATGSGRANRGTRSYKIAIVLAGLNVGGVQRMRINLARVFIAKGLRVDFVARSMDGPMRETLPAGAEKFEFGRGNKITWFFGLLKYLRKNSPTHIMSAYDDINIMVLMANWLLGSRSFVLVSTHNALSKVRYEGGYWGRIKYYIILHCLSSLYRKAGAVVAVSQGLALELEEFAKLRPGSVQVIYNPVITSDFRSMCRSNESDKSTQVDATPLVGFFGRFHSQKRVDVLLRAFARARKVAHCRLLLVGEGEEEGRLRSLCSELEIASYVVFHPFEMNPFPLMKRCQVVVLPSAYEGLGNVLIEAMACGTQVISTDCPHGPREILEDGQLGQLVAVGDVGGLAEAIRRTLTREFWIDEEALRSRGRQFSTEAGATNYLKALGLSEAVNYGDMAR